MSVTDGGSTGSTGGMTGPSSGHSTVLARLLGGPMGVSRYRAGALMTRLRFGGILKQHAKENRTGIALIICVYFHKRHESKVKVGNNTMIKP